MHSETDTSGWSTGSGLVAILLWSTTFAFARGLSEQVGPLTAGAAVYLLGGAVCLGRLFWSSSARRNLINQPLRYLFGCGGLFVLYTAAVYLAVGLARDREQTLEVALINYLWPALTILFSLWLLRRRANALLVPGTLLAVVGVVLVMTQGAGVSLRSFLAHLQSNPSACLLALVAAVSWALYSNLVRLWAKPGSDGAVAVFIPATGLVLMAMRLCVQDPTGWTARAVAEGVGLAVVTTLSYVLWDVAMRRGNMLFVLACSYFTPLLSTLVSAAYLGVSPGPQLWLGCLLLVLGSLLTWRSVSATEKHTRLSA